MQYEEFLKLLRKYEIYHDYPVKGLYFLGTFSTLILKKINIKFDELTGVSRSTCSGLTKEASMQKQLTHFNIPEKNLFKCDNLFLKPTSESLLYDSEFFKKNCRMQKDLPFKVHYVNRVYRKEDRSQPLIRHSEILGFTEVHEVYPADVDAQSTLLKFVNIYCTLVSYLRIPHLVIERPKEDRFIGANNTIAIDTVIFNKRLQIATAHDLGFQWGKLYNIEYKKGDAKYTPRQYSYGHSERILMAFLYFNYNGLSLKLPQSMRAIEAIYVDTPYYFIKNVELIHEISAKKLSYVINAAIWRDSVIIIIDARHDKVKIIDRDEVHYIFKNNLCGFNFRKKDNYKFKNDISHFDKYISTDFKTAWGFNLDKTYMYSGPSF